VTPLQGENAQVKVVFKPMMDNVTNPGIRTFLSLRIQNRKVIVLCDSGSAVNLIPEKLAKPSRVSSSTIRLKAANGTPIPILGTTKIYAFRGRHRMSIEGVVTKFVSRIILGADWMSQNQMI